MMPLLRFWLSPISGPIEMQLLDHLEDVTKDGAVVERASAPERVSLYGADEVHTDRRLPTTFFRSSRISQLRRSFIGCMGKQAGAPSRFISAPSLPSLGSSHRNSGTRPGLPARLGLEAFIGMNPRVG
jgi:hypothetical protein